MKTTFCIIFHFYLFFSQIHTYKNSKIKVPEVSPKEIMKQKYKCRVSCYLTVVSENLFLYIGQSEIALSLDGIIIGGYQINNNMKISFFWDYL